MMTGVRVVVGHEPRCYREMLAGALSCLRPDADVVLAEPDDLPEAVAGHHQNVVVCSQLTQAVRDHSLAWILLYPDAENLAVIGLAAEQRAVPGVQLDDLLAIIDDADRLAKQPTEDPTTRPEAPEPDSA